MILQIINDYKIKYNKLPKNVIFYRMGLSEA